MCNRKEKYMYTKVLHRNFEKERKRSVWGMNIARVSVWKKGISNIIYLATHCFSCFLVRQIKKKLLVALYLYSIIPHTIFQIPRKNVQLHTNIVTLGGFKFCLSNLCIALSLESYDIPDCFHYILELFGRKIWLRMSPSSVVFENSNKNQTGLE